MSPFPSRFDRPEESPGFLLWQVTNLWQRTLRDVLEPLDLTHVQFVLLATVRWLEGSTPVKQEDVSELARVDPMTTSQAVRKLEAKGFVQRAPHPADGRAVQVSTTPAGRRTLRRALPAVEAADEQFFAPLGPKGGAMARSLRMLAR